MPDGVANWKGSRLQTKSVTLPNGQTKTASIDLNGLVPVGVFFPNTAEGTTLKFEVSPDGTTFYPLYGTDGSEVGYTVPATTAHYLQLEPTVFCGVSYLKLVVSSQTGDTVVKLALRAV